MKYLLSTLLFFAVLNAEAQPLPSLKTNMQNIGDIVDVLEKNAAQKSSPALDTDSANQAAQLVKLFTAAKGQVPDSLNDYAPADKGNAIAAYQKGIQGEIDQAASLQKAFQTNDHIAAAKILKTMDVLKHRGHEQFAD